MPTMFRNNIIFSAKLAAIAAILFLAHWYILEQIYSDSLFFPLWQVYLFNAALVLGMYVMLSYYANRKPGSVLQVFMLLSILKMAFVIVFLLPLFLGKADNAQVEVINFFIPYFGMLIFEILALNKFLQKG